MTWDLLRPRRRTGARRVAEVSIEQPTAALACALGCCSARSPRDESDATREPVETGLDVLRGAGFAPLDGRRVGLLTNHTGLARDGATAIDLLFETTRATLVSLFSPEHGIRGTLDARVPSTFDHRTGLPIHSLYGKTSRPTPAMLRNLDALVVDLQDVGARFDPYLTTAAYLLERAAKHQIAVFVLDRPNPLGGVEVEGPAFDERLASFVGYFPSMPVRHGMTLGELAGLLNDERELGADLTVVAMRGWRRDQWFDATGLAWVDPSPICAACTPPPCTQAWRCSSTRTCRWDAAPTPRLHRWVHRGSTTRRSPTR